MNERRRFFLLIFIMVVACFIVECFSILILYDTAFQQQGLRLIETAQSQVALIEAIAKFDAKYHEEYPEGSTNATLSQIVDAHENYKGFGETGEFTLSRRDGDNIMILLSHRNYDKDKLRSVPFNSELAEPMRLALMGKSGIITGVDYRGVMVFAAYEPVKELGMGIVVKIDLSEIRAPFIKAGLISGLVTTIVVIIGSLIFIQKSDPILLKLQKRAAMLEILNNKMGEEITLREKTEEEFRQSKTMLQSVFDGISDPLILLGKDMIVEVMNKTAIKYYDVELQHVIGKPCYLGLRKKNTICNGCEMLTDIITRETLTYERKCIIDIERDEHVSVYPLHGKAVEAGAIMHITDTTENKRIKKQLIRANRLSSLGQLAGGIAHEIRNPLASIRLFSDILCDENRFNREDNEKELFDDINKSINRIDVIIKMVQNYAIKTADFSGKADINNIILNVLDLFSTRMADSKIKHYLSLMENIPLIDGDPVDFQQMITNLIINAIDAMGNGGILNVTTVETNSSLFENLSVLAIIIKDTGQGIKHEDYENIFNPFFTTKSIGTGLGLSITHQILECYGGNINIESMPGDGSLFTIELPLQRTI